MASKSFQSAKWKVPCGTNKSQVNAVESEAERAEEWDKMYLKCVSVKAECRVFDADGFQSRSGVGQRVWDEVCRLFDLAQLGSHEERHDALKQIVFLNIKQSYFLSYGCYCFSLFFFVLHGASNRCYLHDDALTPVLILYTVAEHMDKCLKDNFSSELHPEKGQRSCHKLLGCF